MSDENQSAQDTTEAEETNSTLLGGESKSEETKTNDKEEETQEKESVVPEKYEFSRAEGSLLSEDDLKSFSEFSKSKGYSQEQAQEILGIKEEALKSYHGREIGKLEELKNTWKQQSESDSEIGGEKFKENVGLAKRVLDKYGTDEFKKAMETSGFGNHPEVLRVFVKIGQAMADDTLETGSQGGEEKSTAQVLYG